MLARSTVIALLAMVLIAGCSDFRPPASPSNLAAPSRPSVDPSNLLVDPAAVHWTKIGPVGAGPTGGFDLVGFSAGYVSIALRDPFEEPVAWFTTDGVTWQATSLARQVPNCPGWGPAGDEEVPDADAAAVATNGHRVVVVGAVQPHDAAGCAGGGSYWPIAWLSDDGRIWRRSEPFYTGGSNGRATAVWPTDDGWQAIAPAPESGIPSIWGSPDGVRWQVVADQRDAGFSDIRSGATAGDTTIVVGELGAEGSSQPGMATSIDGGEWQVVDDIGACSARPARILPPAVEGLRAWIVLGDPEICTSVDLVRWSSVTLPMPVWRLTQTRHGAIAIGDLCALGGDACIVPERRAFRSTNGVSWTRIPHPDVPFDQGIADGPAGVLLLGLKPDGNAEVWRLDP